MYINRIDPQINNRSTIKPRKKRDGDKTFADEMESLLDVVTIEHVDPDGKKREEERPDRKPASPRKEDSGERKIDVVC